ncbi:hypothetical protein EMPS_04551 [Entomortierella parvispora]|uniref:Uncharacterized protein n=1 Tax=Entomortierella parvispora TaxID=205924 RepID=A0A9P3H8P6_9FUNG|nr:hypothetical protein EMPS_04551 [Entomortierella parvispora]
MEQRKQVQGIRLTPLPDSLISTYQPGYLRDLSAAMTTKPASEPPSEAPSEAPSELPSEPAYDIDKDPTTKFLTFLPHSGFHNQRTELENALLLARLLNRTLIMPKVYLGPPMPWLVFRHLHSRLLYQNKIGLDHCRAIIELQEAEEESEEELGQNEEKPTPPLRKEHYENTDQPPLAPPPQVMEQPPQEQQQQQPPPQGPPTEPSQTQLYHHHHHQLTHDQPQRPPVQSAEDIISPVLREVMSLEDQIRAEKDTDESNQVSLDPNTTADDDADEQLDDESREETDLQSDYSGSLDDDSSTSMEEEVEEEEDPEDSPSWIEEADEEEEEMGIATGDNPQDILDLELDQSGEEYEPEVEDWETIKEGEEGEGEEEADFGELPIGIEDDDEEEEDEMDLAARRYRKDWGQDPFSLPIQRERPRRTRGRQLSQLEDSEVAWPLYLPVDSTLREEKPRLWKRSFIDERPGSQQQDVQVQEQATGPRFQKRQIPQQFPLQELPQPIVPSAPLPATRKPKRRMKWSPLPTECLQYESWTMTDWDLFFNLDPLRRYVRILTRESMSMAYLESRFNITMPKDPEPIPSNSTSNGTASTDGSDEAHESEIGLGEDDISASEEAEEGEGEEGEEEAEKVVPLLRTEGDVLFFDDSNLYDYRFTENPDDPESLRTRAKFGQEFTIETMKNRPERLIHLGSMFGTGRVSIESLENKAWLLTIKDHLILRTEILQATSQRIADRISGTAHPAEGGGTLEEQRPKKDAMESGFVGIHIRMSDGHFSLSARDTIENIRQELLWQTGVSEGNEAGHGSAEKGVPPNAGSDSSYNMPPAQKMQDRLSIEQCRARALDHHRNLQLFLEQQRQEKQQRQQQQQQQQGQENPIPLAQQQQQQQQQQHTFSHRVVESNASPPRRRSNGRYTPIYLATDAHQPRSNPIFDKLFESFDCIFTLDDFTEDLEPLHRFRNPEDGTLMAKFLIPMVDAMVVAKAAAFFGTPASTFSNYILKQLRPAYTGLYD